MVAKRAALPAEKLSYDQIAADLKGFTPKDCNDLIVMDLPPKRTIMSWALTATLNMLYSVRGLGKTQFALELSFAMATGGSFLGWIATQKWKVLYVDGEMSAATMQSRVIAMCETRGVKPDRGFFTIITPDFQGRSSPNLASVADRQSIDVIADQHDVIVIDNLSCLLRGGGEENSAESADFIGEWALPHRAAGRTVIIIHHAGKGGQQRGTSKREDLLDTVIALRKPSDYQASDGARFEVHFEKARHMHGVEIDPFEAALVTDERGNRTWTTKSLEGSVDARILDLMNVPNMSLTDVAKELHVNKSTVSRRVKALRERGLLQEEKKVRQPKQQRLQQVRNDE